RFATHQSYNYSANFWRRTLAPNNIIHGTPDAILGAGLKPTAGVTDVSFRTFLSIVKSAQRRRRCCYSQHGAIIGVFDNVDGLRDSRVFRVDGRLPTMTCTAVAVQQTVDRTPRGAFNRPFRRRRPARDSADSGPGGRVEGDRRAAGGAGAGARGCAGHRGAAA